MASGHDTPMEEFEAGRDATVTVGEWTEEMRGRLRPAAERAHIAINSTIMWPVCAMDPFLEACETIVRLRALVDEGREYRKRVQAHCEHDWAESLHGPDTVGEHCLICDVDREYEGPEDYDFPPAEK